MTAPGVTVDDDAAPTTGRPRRVSDDQIFAALTEQIDETGPDGVTLARVAARTGMTGPALGHRFGSKRGLLLAFAERQVAAMDEHFDAAEATNPSPIDALMAALTSVGARTRTRAEVANNLAMLNLDLADDELGHFAAAQSRVLRRRIVDLLEAANFGTASQRIWRADDLYVVWSGGTLTWAIDGDGPLEDWLTERLRRTINSW
ncbi:MAG: TetR/AcrR family transcriptional regulator [Actinobacteria bacterium]|nr:MAG: TetR/AcrR family transcriptional regulator [Actinomycetota bacterium]